MRRGRDMIAQKEYKAYIASNWTVPPSVPEIYEIRYAKSAFNQDTRYTYEPSGSQLDHAS